METEFSAVLRGVTETLDACAALWPPPTLRFCAVGRTHACSSAYT